MEEVKTPFSAVYDCFLNKITDDMYMELTPEDTIRDLRRLLLNSIVNFEYPRKNLNDYILLVETINREDLLEEDYIFSEDTENDTVDVDRSYFNEELTIEEIDILAILMMGGWLQRLVTSIEHVRMKYSGTDFKMTSLANHLSKLLTLLTECRRQSHHAQRLYKRRELNSDSKYQSTWYWFGPQE